MTGPFNFNFELDDLDDVDPKAMLLLLGPPHPPVYAVTYDVVTEDGMQQRVHMPRVRMLETTPIRQLVRDGIQTAFPDLVLPPPTPPPDGKIHMQVEVKVGFAVTDPARILKEIL